MNGHRTLTASEAYDDCLTLFEKTLQPAMAADTGGFTGEMIPGSEFSIKLSLTHGALTTIVKRYPAAEFNFHSERQLIPTKSSKRNINPLVDLYAEVTIDFTPYGTGIGSSSDDDGGGETHSDAEDAENEFNGISTDSTQTAPSGPSAPSVGENDTSSPAIA
jgi:hypothetical protein